MPAGQKARDKAYEDQGEVDPGKHPLTMKNFHLEARITGQVKQA